MRKLSNSEIREEEERLYAERRHLAICLESEQNPVVKQALAACYESVVAEIEALPMPDLDEDAYWEDLEREYRQSLPRLTLKEEVEIFEAVGIVKELSALARETGDLALEARMNRYQAAMADRPDYRVRQDDITYVRSIPIVSFLESRGVKVNKIGYACCPIHQEKTASFRVYKNNSWFCFGCGSGGDIITLLMKLDNLSFREAVRQLR